MGNKAPKNSGDYDAAYDAIIDAIVTQKLAPSQKVSESIFTDMFGISRTTARNIMERLTAQQFLVSVSPRITRVASLTLLDVKQNFALRKMLQPNIMAMAAPFIKADQLAKLNEAIHFKGSLTEESQALTLLKANKRFNLYVSEKLSYPLLLNWIEQLEDTTMRIYWLYMKMMDSLPFTWEHQRELVQAIEDDQSEEIIRITNMILTLSEERVLKAVFSHNHLITQDLTAP